MSRIQMLRFDDPGVRPVAGTQPVGSIFINFADGVFGFIDENGDPAEFDWMSYRGTLDASTEQPPEGVGAGDVFRLTTSIPGSSMSGWMELVPVVDGSLVIYDGAAWAYFMPASVTISPTAPLDPGGGLWWNPVVEVLSVWNGTAWRPARGLVTFGPDAPVSPNFGDTWFNTTTFRQRMWSGSAWVQSKQSAVQGTEPASPSTGDLWFDTASSGKIRAWDGTSWNSSQLSVIAASAPVAPEFGDLWHDTTSLRMKAWNGAAWLLSRQSAVSAAAPTPQALGDVWFDTVKARLKAWNGSTWLTPEQLRFAASAPSTPVHGDLWYDTALGALAAWHSGLDTWLQMAVTLPAAPPGMTTFLSADPDGVLVWEPLSGAFVSLAPDSFTQQTIEAQNVTQSPLSLKGMFGQTAPLFRVRDSTSAELLRIDADGTLTLLSGKIKIGGRDIEWGGGDKIRWDTAAGLRGYENSELRWTLGPGLTFALHDSRLSFGTAAYFWYDADNDRFNFVQGSDTIGRIGYSQVTFDAITRSLTGSAANVHVSSGGSLFESTSSGAFKVDRRGVETPLDLVARLKPLSFRSTHKADADRRFMGFIAEEVTDVLPEADLNGKNYDVRALVALTVSAIQELRARVDYLEFGA